MQIKYREQLHDKQNNPTGKKTKLYDQIIDSPKFKSKLLVRSNQLSKRADELEKKYQDRN